MARSSGKEFYVLIVIADLPNDKATALVNGVRTAIGNTSFQYDDKSLRLSFSAGVSYQLGERFNDVLVNAETYMQRAKEAGKDIVMGDDDSF